MERLPRFFESDVSVGNEGSDVSVGNYSSDGYEGSEYSLLEWRPRRCCCFWF